MHGLHISGGFTLPLHRLLLGKKITLSDIETVDPDLHRSFVWILYVTVVLTAVLVGFIRVLFTLVSRYKLQIASF